MISHKGTTMDREAVIEEMARVFTDTAVNLLWPHRRLFVRVFSDAGAARHSAEVNGFLVRLYEAEATNVSVSIDHHGESGFWQTIVTYEANEPLAEQGATR